MPLPLRNDIPERFCQLEQKRLADFYSRRVLNFLLLRTSSFASHRVGQTPSVKKKNKMAWSKIHIVTSPTRYPQFEAAGEGENAKIDRPRSFERALPSEINWIFLKPSHLLDDRCAKWNQQRRRLADRPLPSRPAHL